MFLKSIKEPLDRLLTNTEIYWEDSSYPWKLFSLFFIKIDYQFRKKVGKMRVMMIFFCWPWRIIMNVMNAFDQVIDLKFLAFRYRLWANPLYWKHWKTALFHLRQDANNCIKDNKCQIHNFRVTNRFYAKKYWWLE